MRPAVLLVEPDDALRHALALGLARYEYEVVPVPSNADGLRFAQGLGPSVIVAPAGLPSFAGGAILERFAVQDRAMQRTLVLLGEEADEAEALPEDVLFLATRNLEPAEIVRRIRLVLVGRELGVEPDVALRSLIGDIALMPVLELLRALNRMRVSGTLKMADGAIHLIEGEVIAAAAGLTSGPKAVFRLSRRGDGPFRLGLGTPKAEQDITIDFFDLLIRAIEEAQVSIPDERARPRLEPSALDETKLSEQEQSLLAVVGQHETVGSLLDALPASDSRIARALHRLVDAGALRLHKPCAQVAIVTDSTGDLPAALVQAHDIEVEPLTVVFGKDRFRDGEEIQPREFYDLLSGPVHPHTEPPTAESFASRFGRLEKRQDVVSIHISAALSETVAHAQEAAGWVGPTGDGEDTPTIEVVDSGSVSMGLGLLALFASRMALRDLDAAAIAERVRAMRERVFVYFVVHNLDALVRGGRLGKTQAAVGKLLGIKPILGMVDGKIVAVERVRGGRRAHPRIVDMLTERLDVQRPVVAAVAHAKAPVWADRLRDLLAERFEVGEVISSDIGPVVGTHTGPGCVGCAVYQPRDDEEWALIRPLRGG